MNFDDYWKRFITSGLTFAVGLFAAAFFYNANLPKTSQKEIESVPNYVKPKIEGRGASDSRNRGDYVAFNKEKTNEFSSLKATKLKIISKPPPVYTDIARKNYVQGTVLLKVTFLANGQIGGILPVKELPDGLTEQAIIAAKEIKFEPAVKNGKPYSVTKTVEYSFAIY